MSNQFVTIQETANRLSVSHKTVRRWLKAGKLHGVRPGGQSGPGRVPWRISEAAIADFLKGSPSNGAAPIGE